MRISISTARQYPLAPIGEWYGECTFEQAGGRMVYMTPANYLRKVRPLTLDEESRENIDLLKEHILEHGTLDPLIIYKGGKEDGRHRAYASLELSIKMVPVIVFDDTIGKTVPSSRYR
jgi:ParB-like nuclease domain